MSFQLDLLILIEKNLPLSRKPAWASRKIVQPIGKIFRVDEVWSRGICPLLAPTSRPYPLLFKVCCPHLFAGTICAIGNDVIVTMAIYPWINGGE